MLAKPCCEPPRQSYLPITTGRIGLSQTTGGLEFYGHNFHGRGIQLFHGRWDWCPPACPPSWPPPTWSCPPSWGGGGCSCGGCGSCPQCCNPCLQGANCFADYLTNPSRWACYYAQRDFVRALTTPPAQGAAA